MRFIADYWAAVKELHLSHHIMGVYIYYVKGFPFHGNLTYGDEVWWGPQSWVYIGGGSIFWIFLGGLGLSKSQAKKWLRPCTVSRASPTAA